MVYVCVLPFYRPSLSLPFSRWRWSAKISVGCRQNSIISVEVSVPKSYVSISCTGAGFPPSPPFGDLRKISSPGNLNGSFSCPLSSGIFFAFSVLIVELIYGDKQF